MKHLLKTILREVIETLAHKMVFAPSQISLGHTALNYGLVKVRSDIPRRHSI